MNIIGISGLHNSVPFKKKEFPRLTPRQYRIAQGFDSAAALVSSRGIEAVAAEERFTREKATGSFPVNAIQFCLNKASLNETDIDFIAHGFAYTPFRRWFEASDFTQKQFREVYSRDAQLRTIQDHLGSANEWDRKFVEVPHHLAHAASAFYLSGFEESLILVADGMGEIHSTTIAAGKDNKIKIIRQVEAVHSLGILYGVFTYYLGFEHGLDEYKVMGLAPYGNAARYFSSVMELIRLKEDGTYTIPILFRNSTLEQRETYEGTLQILESMFGPRREPGSDIEQNHKDVAAALQMALQACLMHILRHFKKETGLSKLCMAGGVALNCTANGLIYRSRLFQNIFIQPAAGDDGTALGAALYLTHNQKEELSPTEKMKLPLWGPAYDSRRIEQALQLNGVEYRRYESFELLAQEIAKRLAQGEVVASFRGAMEFGPRALGNRSILADPRNPEMRARINRLVKKREDFRPFAPAVAAEAASKFFNIVPGEESTFSTMLFVTQVLQPYRERLPAVTHVDGSARVQTVSVENHPQFWMLLNEFGKLTGFPILLNTSFNVKGQPIVCSPEEAVETFLSAHLDAMAIEDYLVTRKQ